MAKSETSVSDSQENEPDSSSEDHITDINGGTEKIPEYERQRRKTIDQNRAKMEALGLNRLSSSLMGSVQKPTKKTDTKGKKKIDEEDEDYMPVDEEDRSVSSSEEEDDNFSGGENSRSRTSKAKGKHPPKKKLVGNSDFVDNDESLMQAIALSLEHSAEMVCSELPRSSDACLNDDLENERRRKSCSEKDLEKRKKRKPQVTSRVQMTEDELVVHFFLFDEMVCSELPRSSDACLNDDLENERRRKSCSEKDLEKRKKRKPQVTSRVQMTEDELVVHFFLFDEAGKGNISVQDIQRLATAHDFAWTDKEMADMITFFVSNPDAKLNLDDFRAIVSSQYDKKVLDDSFCCCKSGSRNMY